jgi:hypothetical protein
VSDRTRRITRIGSVAGYVVAVAGAITLVTTVLGLGADGAWQTINDLGLLVLVTALAPLMLSFYELGGLTPTILAQLAQTIGWAAVLAFCTIQVLQLAGVVQVEWRAAATGAFAIGSGALGYIGLWINGANLLAGRWLGPQRWLGFLGGLALTLFAVGLLVGGVDTGWATVGGIAFLVLLPAWAFLMGRLLRRLSAG